MLAARGECYHQQWVTISPVPTVMARGADGCWQYRSGSFLEAFNISHAHNPILSRPASTQRKSSRRLLPPTHTHVQRVQFLSTRDGHSTQLDQPSRDEWTLPVRGDEIPGIGYSVANATVLQPPGLLLAPRVSSSFLSRWTKRHALRGANPKEGSGHGKVATTDFGIRATPDKLVRSFSSEHGYIQGWGGRAHPLPMSQRKK